QPIHQPTKSSPPISGLRAPLEGHSACLLLCSFPIVIVRARYVQLKQSRRHRRRPRVPWLSPSPSSIPQPCQPVAWLLLTPTVFQRN
ncbi:hypothetical protein BDZ90DRAFT_249461, partial [Jaminaea rosea]